MSGGVGRCWCGLEACWVGVVSVCCRCCVGRFGVDSVLAEVLLVRVGVGVGSVSCWIGITPDTA